MRDSYKRYAGPLRDFERSSYRPYQVVELADGSGKVELMSYPFANGDHDEVFARTIIGDETSARYMNVSALGKIVAASAGDRVHA